MDDETRLKIEVKEETASEFLIRLGTDGDAWAKEFMKMNPDTKDLDLMRAWFANMIMAGYDRGYQKGQAALHKIYLEAAPEWNRTETERVVRNREGDFDYDIDGHVEFYAFVRGSGWQFNQDKILLAARDQRIRELETALERIKGMCDVGPTCACGRPNGWPAVIGCANSALSKHADLISKVGR